jgi:2-polyprenyl-6-methoxyphenol hydroxylase-like FAD-dependent oxidoreductase
MQIAISGIGVAGPTLAYWLHRTGHHPTLIEQAPHLRTGGYVIDFWGVGYQVAERMGLEPALRTLGYAVQEVRLVDSQGRSVSGFSVDAFRRLTGGRYLSLPRGELAAAIYRRIEGCVETIFGESIAAIAEHDRGVRVTLAGGATRDFDLVIGADGLHSAVRERVFGPDREFETPLGFHVAAFELTGYRPRDELTFVSYTVPERSVGRFALRDDRTLILCSIADTCLPGPAPQTLDARKALLHRLFAGAGWECPQILRAMEDVAEIYFDRVSQIRMACWSRGRVMLIGDAAACVSLLAGEGTGLAMTEAYVLAGELHQARGNYQDAFVRHEQRLRPFITGKQAAAARLAAGFVPTTPFQIWRRNQAVKLLSIAPLANLLLGRSVRDEFTLPEYGMEVQYHGGGHGEG